MAVDEINATGGIKSLGGAKLKVIDADTEGKPETAMQECEKLTRQGVAAILGAYQSAATFTSTAIAEKHKVPYIIPIGVADEITERGFKYVFRPHGTASGISRDSIAYIVYLNQLTGKHYHRVAHLFEDTIFGQSTAKALRKYAAEANIEIVADLPYPANSPDLTQTIMKVKQARPNFIIGTSYVQDAMLILNTVKDLNVDVEAFLGIGSGYSNPQILQLGKAAEYMIVLDSLNGDLKIKGLKEASTKFAQLYKGEAMDGSAGQSYAAVYILKDALERAGSTDREKIRNALAASNLAVGEKGNITTARIKFDEKGQVDFHYMFKQVLNGKFVSVYPPDLAPRAAVFPVPKWKDR
jgi:branched-chain amino acid transport system substrate-binding protein